MKTIKISEDDWEVLEQRAKEKNMDANKYFESLIKQIIDKIMRERTVYSKEDEESIKNRLKNLGYL